jgi:hypothetical protein
MRNWMIMEWFDVEAEIEVTEIPEHLHPLIANAMEVGLSIEEESQ